MASQAQSLYRLVIGGGILTALVGAYVAALFLKPDGAQALLPVIASGLGFLLADHRKPTQGDQ